MNKVKKSVMTKITKNQVRIKPKVRVWLEQIGLDGGFGLILVGLAIISGFLLFWINSNIDLFGYPYSNFGTGIFFQLFPYSIFAGFILLFVILSMLLRRYDFSYRHSFIGTLLLMLLSAAFVGLLSFGNPQLNRLYRLHNQLAMYGQRGNHLVAGVVRQIYEDRLIIISRDESVNVRTNNQTTFPFGRPSKGDFVRVVGSKEGPDFTAFVVRVFGNSQITPRMWKLHR